MLDKFRSVRLTKFDWLLSLIIVFIFFAHLVEPRGIELGGIDPSWSYAISRFSETNLIFGRDVIFTYGPLGHFVLGAAIESNRVSLTLLRSIVHFILMGFVIVRIINLKTYRSKIIFAITIIALFLFGGGGRLGMTTDYKILATFLIAITFDAFIIKYLPWFSLALGVLAGLSILSKLTLGFYIIGSFYLFVLGSFLETNFIKNNKIYKIFIVSILNFTFVTIFIALTFLYYPKVSLDFTAFFISLFISLIVYILLDKASKRYRFNRNFKSSIPLFASYTLYGVLFVQTVDRENFSFLLNYVRNSGQISSGYSSSMSLIGPLIGLYLAIFCLILLLFLIYRLAKRSLGLALAFSFTIFLGFKHGFVRQDGHIVLFIITVILLSSLCIIKLENDKTRTGKISFINMSHIIFVSILISCIVLGRNLGYYSRIKQFSPSRAIRNIESMILLADQKGFIERERKLAAQNLIQVKQSLKLPDTVLKTVGEKTIDIIPWEFSIVPANNLNWKARPIIQSYSAYTEKLDEINYQNLSGSPRDFIFYHFESIDKRHPFFDEPKAFSHIVCHYKPDSIPESFTTNPVKRRYFLLDKQNESRCTNGGTGESTAIAWNTAYELPIRADSLTRAKIEFQYSPLGKLVKLLFRIPPVYMNVNYLDDTSARYRIVQDNSANGPIVSHLPRNQEEITAFLRGELPPQVKAFQFEVDTPRLFAPEITITPFFETYR
jgi:hypothetical protein